MKGFIVKKISDNQISYIGNQGCFITNKEDARIFRTKKGARRARYQEEHSMDDPFGFFNIQKPDETFEVEEV